MENISVIVPIYNVEKYLRRCVDSLLKQTLENIEILLINDGSTDKSGQICDEYLKIDNRIRVFHKRNGGVSSARNLGLENIKGGYVTFVDPDDYLDEDALEYLYKLIKESNSDIACYKLKIYKDDVLLSKKLEYEKLEIFNEDEIIKNQVAFSKFSHTSCNKLYSKNLFKDEKIRFEEEIRYAEDALFNVYILSKAKRLISSNLAKYNYFINEGSTVNKVTDKRIDILKAQRYMIDFLKKNYDYGVKYIIKDYIGSSIAIAIDLAKSKGNIEMFKILKLLKIRIQIDKYILKDTKNINIKNKIMFSILKKNPILIVILYKIKFLFFKEK